jgi:glutamate-1-semialdehyde aminotransferase
MTDRFDAPATRELELAARYPRSAELYTRAIEVIPGGFHLSGRPLVDPATTPMYFERGKGCRIWDADGHEYVDYLMAFGAYLLGYARPEVDQAAFEQGQKGRLLSLNHRKQVEFIESLLPLFPGAEMGVFFKTGSEATTAALRIARRRTGRRRVARCGYHGWHDWCLPLEDFVPAGLGTQVPEFNANEPRSLQALFETYPNDIAAVILAPEMVLPHEPQIFHELARISRAGGALFILDEVKTGLRIAPNSVAERVGVVPDLITVSKALGNGWPVAVTLGRREVMQAAAGMHYSATFHGDVAAIAAARVTLSLVQGEPVQRHIEHLGGMLIDGLNALARELDVPAKAFGEPLPAMPFFRFEHPEPKLNAELTRYFFQEILARGVLLHPRHMWFLSYAHREEDIAFTLDMARAALRAALGRLGHGRDQLALAKSLG